MIHPMLREKEAQLAALCEDYGVVRLDVFGSSTGPDFSEESSDLDFLVTFAASSSVEHAQRYFGLLFALEDLFGRSVDLVEEGCIDNPHVLREVEKQRRPLYAA